MSFTAVLNQCKVQEIIHSYCTVIKLRSSSSRKYQLVLIAGSSHRGMDQPSQHLQRLKASSPPPLDIYITPYFQLEKAERSVCCSNGT